MNRAGRGRLLAFVGAASLASAGLGAPAAAMQPDGPDAATQAAMDKRAAARTLLSSALARIAANANDPLAQFDAGRASMDLEDHRAALAFLLRAEQLAPRDSRVKAALGSVMVHLENPTRALDYFGEAQLLGAPERSFLADRGLAHDLLGQQQAAQRDYQLAMTLAPSDDLARRYALSLGISGDPTRAVELLTPQLRRQDRGAWRTRAMVLAMNGYDKEAREIVERTMPANLAQSILPFLMQMDRLTPVQMAAAAHFGRFPSGPLGPKRAPVQMAAATSGTDKAAERSRDRKSRRSAESTRRVAAATPTPPSTRAGGSTSARSATPTPPQTSAPLPALQPALQPATRPAVPPPVQAQPAPAPVPQPMAQAPAQAPVQTPEQPVIPSPAPSAPSAPAAAPQSMSPTPAAPSAPAAEPRATPAALPPAGAITTPTPVSPTPVTPAPATPSDPVGPGFSIRSIGEAPPSSGETATSAAMPANPAAPNAAAPLAPLASLGDIIGSIEIPPEEMQRPEEALSADVLARLQAEKRRAEAAEAARREKEAAAAKAKAEAEARAKAEAEAKEKAEAERKKDHPARQWVQIATGANLKALAFDYNRFAKRNAALFKGHSGATAEWGRTRRLLVGPFKDRKSAQDWLDDYKKAEGDGFLFNSDAGEVVEPIK
ncbi:tetratricopeptide repeat protein [Sphingopyxis sp. MWB1]|uniref:tetratricopeptide repeat protein n=1 Tax=Sphingopyxis sp. MWB1 TaxID=1537715 RepID=UPI00051A37D2|nr:hypothetical protein [Sphingopyxis sp. MWB1]